MQALSILEDYHIKGFMYVIHDILNMFIEHVAMIFQHLPTQNEP